jgi:hypothetical protein
MSEQKINPHQVTKPIQLLAAWLVGLILINGSFLSAAKIIESPEWASGCLVIAAVLNVPIFLVLIFFLQTKFRAELQEDTYYSKHLEKVTGTYKNADEIALIAERAKQVNNDKIDVLIDAVEKLSFSLASDDIRSDALPMLPRKEGEIKKSIVNIGSGNHRSIVKVALNDLIPSYKIILKSLIRAGYSITEIFGSTSKDKRPPKNLIITCNADVPKAALKEIYEIIKPYGFDRIDIDINPRPMELANIYIGSYVDDYSEQRESIEIDGDLEDLLFDENISGEQLAEYVRNIRFSS